MEGAQVPARTVLGLARANVLIEIRAAEEVCEVLKRRKVAFLFSSLLLKTPCHWEKSWV
jgi:hypothetical protein